MRNSEDNQVVGPSEMHFGLSGLDRIRKASNKAEFSDVLFDIARDYAPYIGLDFDKDVLPNLGNKAWWDADYGVSEVNGRAIGMSSRDAFRCLVDTERTFQLAQGIRETVSYLKQQKAGSLTAIDAGTGTGVLSILLAAYGVDAITAIEFKDETFGYTQDFLKKLGLDKKINIMRGDATQIDLAQEGVHDIDMLVSENLSGGLMEEPQYDIISHLSQYLAKDAKIVPYGAELSVSVAHADWEGIDPEEVTIALRRLRRCEELSESIPYAQVESHVGMEVPIIEGNVVLSPNGNEPINTLIVSTKFQINEVGQPFYLDGGDSEFLGKRRAFRIEGEVTNSDALPVNLKYRTGVMGKYMHVTADRSSITLSE